jgi:hypothetical protein
VKLQTAVFPPGSVAVKEILVTPIGKADPEGKPAVCVIVVPAQLSLTVGAAQVTTALQKPGVLLTAMLAGQNVNTGGWLSLTVTVNEHNTLFPLASVAEYTMLVVPIGKTEPLGNPDTWVTIKPGQFSVAIGAIQFTTAPHVPGVLFTVILAGHDVKTGASLSVTVTVNEHVVKFPTASVAVYDTVVVPTGKFDPFNKPEVCVTVTPAQLSFATGTVHVTGELQIPAELPTTMLAGHDVNTGGSPSVTVMVNEQVEVFP